MEGEGHGEQTPLACVGSAPSGWATRGLPGPKVVTLPRSKLLRRLGTSWGDSPRWVTCLRISQVQATQAPRCALSVQSQVDRESPQEASLGRETPGRYEPFRLQEDVVNDWQPVHSLMGAAVSGTEIAMAPCVPTLGIVHMPLFPPGECLKQLPACSPLVFTRAQSFVCECTRGHSAALEPSRGKGLCFSLSLCHSHGLSCFVTLAPSECPQGIQPL